MNPSDPGAERRDLAACRQLLRHGSRTFYAASFLLPRATREPASALYAFCRLADDAVDLTDDHAGVLELLHARLDRIYAGAPMDHPADRAFSHVVKRFGVPQTLPDALLEGFQWDAEGRRYADLDALREYCVRVAGTVGVMMALLMGRREPDALARACDLGVAMQLTNIARDVGEDAANGRIYLPLEWLRDAGIDADRWLRSPRHDAALGGVVAKLLDEAERLYARARVGIAALPVACRPGINAARLLYREIGMQVIRHGLDSVTRRAVVPGSRKAQVLLAALGPTPEASIAAPLVQTDDGVLAQARFLIDAAGSTVPAPAARRAAVLPALDRRFEEVIDLFVRLEHRDRDLRIAASARRGMN